MKRIIGVLAIGLVSFGFISLRNHTTTDTYYSISELKALYGSGNKDLWPKPTLDSTITNFEDLGVLPQVVFPEDNRFSEAKRELGKVLFFDPRLSASGQISCASCHDPELGWGDGKKIAHGHDRATGQRNSKPIINSAYAKVLFWDGRATSLEDQARFPIVDEKEMSHSIKTVVKQLKKIKGYRKLFADAFGSEEINIDKVTKAIATFERTVVSRKSRFDKFIEGDSTQLSNKEVEGLHLFRTDARCLNCHNSPYFSDNQFHNAGLTYYGRKFEDLGLYDITGNRDDVGKFKTPSLREILHTGPYMHNGLFPTIRGVLNMYNAGMPNNKPKEGQENDPLFPETSSHLLKLDLSESQLDALEAFLGSITSTIYREPPPEVLPQ